MTTPKIVTLSALTAVVVALLVTTLFPSTVTKIVQETTGQNLGAVSNPDIQSPYFSFGGVRQWAGTADFRSASTTFSLQAPSATTTLVSATCRFDSVPAASVWELGNAVTAYATTTSLGTLTLAAGAQGSLTASSSAANLFAGGVVTPLTYINLKLATTTATYTGWAPTGRCSVVFREI